MKPVRTFTVVRPLPDALRPLHEIAYNLWWSWNDDARRLLERVHPDLWALTRHNPLLTLERMDPSRLETLAADADFLAHMERVLASLRGYMSSTDTWCARQGPGEPPTIAYFSAEFAVTECLPIFSGGLGVLAGDHLKSASDLGVPLVAVGLLYGRGYFHQSIDADGRQVESYVEREFEELPLTVERRPDGSPVTIEVALPGRRVHAQVWRAQVGRVALFLLDTNLPNNWTDDRGITGQLYGGDLEMRIKQEIVLGIGGVRALEALGLKPSVFHMNEGHSAFLALERIRRLMQSEQLGFAEAREAAASSLVFTTHTPVEAGHDYFPPEMFEQYLGGYARDLGITRDELLALGRRDPQNPREAFCMTILAMRTAGYANGVSELHGAVSRKMWRTLWPGLPEEDVPIGHVTNGVHLPSWVAPELMQIFDEAAGPGWRDGSADVDAWRAVQNVDDTAIWESHQACKAAMLRVARQAWRSQLKRNGAPPDEVAAADAVLSDGALTIGFARRFATYKRATLLLRDRERLRRLLADPERPVQFVFAGKAHPRDQAGKEFIHQINQLARDPEFAGRVLFLEDYDPAIARALVRGVDVWLNTPRRPLEASGTSGMKAAANGVLNLSVLDGWWAEAWKLTRDYGAFGWAFGLTDGAETAEEQDAQDAEALFDLIEKEVVPLYYELGGARVPVRWVERMKASIAACAPVFNTDRMVQEYVARYYLPLARRYARLASDGYARTRELARWKSRVAKHWPEVKIHEVGGDAPSTVPAGRKLQIRAWIDAAGLEPEELRAELYVGKVNGEGDLAGAVAAPMRLVETDAERGFLFESAIAPPDTSELQGYTVRVLPHHVDLVVPYVPGLVTWAESNGGGEA